MKHHTTSYISFPPENQQFSSEKDDSFPFKYGPL